MDESMPRLRNGVPVWFNPGTEVARIQEGSDESRLVLVGDSGRVVIERPPDKDRFWLLRWSLSYTEPYAVFTGRLLIHELEMFSTFALQDFRPNESHDLLREFGGSSAVVGVYIRWGRFLSIPGPGSGFLGDPNLSIRVTEGMRRHVQILLKCGRFEREPTLV